MSRAPSYTVEDIWGFLEPGAAAKGQALSVAEAIALGMRFARSVLQVEGLDVSGLGTRAAVEAARAGFRQGSAGDVAFTLYGTAQQLSVAYGQVESGTASRSQVDALATASIQFGQLMTILGTLTHERGPTATRIRKRDQASAAANKKNATAQAARATIRAAWASGKYLTKEACADAECDAAQVSFYTAKKALRNAPMPLLP
jgi:hypothetical protein